MHVQWCVKGIAGAAGGKPGITRQEAQQVVSQSQGILSNWWRNKGTITRQEIAAILTDKNLDRHLHDYARFGPHSPFISLACGAVERDALVQANYTYSAVDTALMFATDDWARPGALFYCWVPTSFHKAAGLFGVAESVRDLNIYQRWSPYQLEGEITAKVCVFANQIQRVEWWDGQRSKRHPQTIWRNSTFIEPDAVSNIRDLF